MKEGCPAAPEFSPWGVSAVCGAGPGEFSEKVKDNAGAHSAAGKAFHTLWSRCLWLVPGELLGTLPLSGIFVPVPGNK